MLATTRSFASCSLLIPPDVSMSIASCFCMCGASPGLGVVLLVLLVTEQSSSSTGPGVADGGDLNRVLARGGDLRGVTGGDLSAGLGLAA